MKKQIKERGIIFNGEMVRAILDGRKTQTRRIISPQPELTEGSGFSWKGALFGAGSDDRETNRNFAHCRCPFGKVGDRLYVRETWGVVSYSFDDDGLMTDWIPDRPAKAIHELPYGRGYYNGHAIYAADGDFTWGDDDGGGDGRSCWNPSIHMPKAASRITLEITDIRVERLNHISEQDAAAEGVGSAVWFAAKGVPENEWTSLGEFGAQKPSHINRFASLWESIYGQDSWQSNPFVWVVEFKRVEAA
ncbi:hypothetical protein [Rosenbergiella nectarea]|uniref:hypothetical protein n=1 Tax=Rosenbergiella nectarea TaxID=988801 RepID=UPI001F4D51B7|nr:hypothetical protein [Rosenbergiella nectarea]